MGLDRQEGSGEEEIGSKHIKDGVGGMKTNPFLEET